MKRLERYLAGVLMAVAATTAAADGVVYVTEPSPNPVIVGAPFAVEIRGKEFLLPIDGGGLNVTFDSTGLELLDIEMGSAWDFVFTWDAAALAAWNAAGEIEDMWFNSFAAPVGGDFLIATLSFSALAAGVAAIAPGLNDDYPFGRGMGEEVTPRPEGREINIAAIPEPATQGILAAGILLMLGVFASRHAGKSGKQRPAG